RRESPEPDLSDLAAQQRRVPRARVRRLRARRARYRHGRHDRRARARGDPELRRRVPRPRARADGGVRAAGAAPDLPADRHHGPKGVRMKRWLPVVLGIAVIAALPVLGDNYLLRLGTMFAMYAVLALSWNIIGGFAGYPSFASAAFFGLGAYSGAILQGAGLPMPLAWAAACLATALFAALLGMAILHLKGHYFAIASLVVGEVLL